MSQIGHFLECLYSKLRLYKEGDFECESKYLVFSPVVACPGMWVSILLLLPEEKELLSWDT